MQYFLLLKLKFMSWTHPIFQLYYAILIRGSQVALVVKSPLAKAGDIRDVGSIPGSRRSLRRAWQPTPVFLPGESHGQRNLAGYSSWGPKESDTTEATYQACTHNP